MILWCIDHPVRTVAIFCAVGYVGTALFLAHLVMGEVWPELPGDFDDP